jgi:hypothetical protein
LLVKQSVTLTHNIHVTVLVLATLGGITQDYLYLCHATQGGQGN